MCQKWFFYYLVGCFDMPYLTELTLFVKLTVLQPKVCNELILTLKNKLKIVCMFVFGVAV